MRQAVAGILSYANTVLIGKKILKKDHFCSGGWHLPGGHVGSGEKPKEAIVREFKEETGLEVTVVTKLCPHKVIATSTVFHWFILTSASCKAVAGDDLSEVKFVDKKLVKTLCDTRAVSLWSPEVFSYLQN